MKNKSFEVLVIILLAGLLLVGFSFLVGQVSVPCFGGKNIHVTFIDKNSLFDFTLKKENTSADSLINNFTEDSVITASNTKLLNEQIKRMSDDSVQIRDIVNYKLNCFLGTDSLKNESSIQKFIKNYLSEEGSRKKKIIKEELLAYLNVKNLKNEFFINPEVDGEKALDKFFNYLMNHKQSEIVRIAHYGDSQIEGDRLTCFLRTRLQARFGGSGLGFVPLIDNTDNVNLSRTHSANWKRYTVFHDRFSNGYYGAAGSVFRFGNGFIDNDEDVLEDTTKTAADNNDQKAKDHKAKGKKTKVKKKKKVEPKNGDSDKVADKNDVADKATYSGSAYVSFSLLPQIRYDHVSLMYGRSKSPCKVNVYCNGEKVFSDDLPETETFKIFDLHIPANTLNFKLEFLSSNSPDFYGLLVDGTHGVQIDNYSLRGHSGDGLMLINQNYFSIQLRKLNTRLIMLQYGINAVPYIKSDKMCQSLEESYVSELNMLKSVAPNASILVIGVGDMARHSEGESASYPMLPKIRDAQKRAALRTNCAFYDLFETMGGLNSIIAWYNKKLASTDGHLTTKGREIIAKDIYDALMIEYDMYRYKRHKKHA